MEFVECSLSVPGMVVSTLQLLYHGTLKITLLLYKFYWWRNWIPERLKKWPKDSRNQDSNTAVCTLGLLMFPNFKEFTILVGNTRNITPLEKAQHCKVGIKQVASGFLPDHGRCQQRWKYNSEVGEWPRLKKKSKSGKEDQFTCTTLIWFTLRVFPSSLHICTFLISLCSASQSILWCLNIRCAWSLRCSMWLMLWTWKGEWNEMRWKQQAGARLWGPLKVSWGIWSDPKLGREVTCLELLLLLFWQNYSGCGMGSKVKEM